MYSLDLGVEERRKEIYNTGYIHLFFIVNGSEVRIRIPLNTVGKTEEIVSSTCVDYCDNKWRSYWYEN